MGQAWAVTMQAGEMKAFAGFSLGVFAPRKGKSMDCRPDDGYQKQASRNSTTLQRCFLECQQDERCKNVFVPHVEAGWLKPVPPVVCTLLGELVTPATACKRGTGTLVKRMNARPMMKADDEAEARAL